MGRQDDLNAARIHTYLAQARELSATRNKESMNSLFRGFLFPEFHVCGLPDSLHSVFLVRQRRGALFGARAPMTTKDSVEITRGDQAEGDNKSLNFKVSSDFKKQFKGFAVAQGITMTELLKEGFALSRKLRQK